MRRLVSAIFFILFSFSVFPLTAKESVPPYAEWISKLSVKQDPGSKNYREVMVDLIALDSLEFCQVFTTLKAKARSGNRRLQIRLMMIESGARSNYLGVPDCPTYQQSPLDLLNAALTIAYELEDDLLTFKVYNALIAYNTDRSIYGQGLLYGLLAKDLYEKLGSDKAYPMASILYNLAFNLYRSRDYKASIDAILKFLSHGNNSYLRPDDTLVNFYTMWSLNTLGLAYAKIEKPDSAFMAFDSAQRIAEREHQTFWVNLIKGNKGDVLFQQGKYDSAEVLLNFDYKTSINAKEYDNAGNSLQWLARIDLIHHKPNDALLKTREAQQLISTSYDPDYMARTLFTYTEVFASLGLTDSVSHYLDKFLMLHDSIEQEASDARTEIVLQRLANQDNMHTIKALNKEKHKVTLVRNFIIALMLLGALTGFMILNRQKLKMKVRRQEALEAKRMAQHEAGLAREQLNLFTRNLIEKTSLVETLQEQLLDREMNEEQKLHIAQLSSHTILTDHDWENFKELFQKVYPGFFNSLKQKVADLTTADQRMAAICKLQVSNKEAATLLGIAPNSVIKAKQRLRHRLGLEPEADLEQFFAQSKEFN